MKTAPIVLFVYNRLEHLVQTIEALQKNTLAGESEVIIFSDGPQPYNSSKVMRVRNYIHTIKGFKSIKVITRKTNYGLARNVISGVSEVFKTHDRVIVLEDDLITSPDFLDFMNGCLETYGDDKRIFSITGYSPNIKLGSYSKDIYLTHRPGSWGWATWKDRWDRVDWEVSDFERFIHNKKLRKEFNRGGEDSSVMLLRQMRGEIDSWAIRFHYSCFKNGGYCVYPVRSRVKSTGTDGSGRHIGKTSKFDLPYNLGRAPFILDPEIRDNDKVSKRFANFYRPSVMRRAINYLRLL